MEIRSIEALEILDSRGNPTIEATVSLSDGASGRASVPSGASTGKHEAHELRDENPERYDGRGVKKALDSITQIAEVVVGLDASEQQEIDKKMIALDDTENKSKLGANAILAVSLAVARAEAKSRKKHLFSYLSSFANIDNEGRYDLPLPFLNIMNGGKHAGWSTDIQEYMIVPVGAESYGQALEMSVCVYHKLKKILKDKGYGITVGDEGGFAPAVKSNAEPFELISQAVEAAGYKTGQDIAFAIDAAASEFYSDGTYKLKREDKEVDSAGLKEFYEDLIGKFPIISLEDIFHEDDWESFAEFSQAHESLQVVGDDLYATNPSRLATGLDKKASNAILVKPNQIGTLSQAIEVINQAAADGLAAMVSHRSGETGDTFIADLAVGLGTGQIKAGAPARGERVAKYNRLLKIEDILQTKAKLAKWPY